MRLYEEYFRRHNIEVPCVRHCLQGSLLLRTEVEVWKSRWLLVNFKWVDDSNHPGLYLFDYLIPIHDGQYRGKLFDRLSPVEKEWDEYEDYLTTWVANVTAVRALEGHRDVTLAAWEMFVFCYDGWFRRQSHELKELLFKSLDDDYDNNRYEAYQDALLYLSTHHPGVLKAWKYEVYAQVQPYADWLAQLVEARCGAK